MFRKSARLTFTWAWEGASNPASHAFMFCYSTLSRKVWIKIIEFSENSMVNFQSSQCMFLRFSVPLGLHSWKVSRDHAHYEPWLVAWSWFADIWDWSPWLNGEWTLLLHGRGLNSELLQTSHLPPWSLGDPSESLRFSNSRGQSLCSWGVESTQRAGSTVLVPSRHWVGSLFSLVILFSLSSSVFLCLSFSSRFLFFFIPRPLPPPPRHSFPL